MVVRAANDNNILFFNATVGVRERKKKQTITKRKTWRRDKGTQYIIREL